MYTAQPILLAGYVKLITHIPHFLFAVDHLNNWNFLIPISLFAG